MNVTTAKLLDQFVYQNKIFVFSPVSWTVLVRWHGWSCSSWSPANASGFRDTG